MSAGQLLQVQVLFQRPRKTHGRSMRSVFPGTTETLLLQQGLLVQKCAKCTDGQRQTKTSDLWKRTWEFTWGLGKHQDLEIRMAPPVLAISTIGFNHYVFWWSLIHDSLWTLNLWVTKHKGRGGCVFTWTFLNPKVETKHDCNWNNAATLWSH